MARIPRRIAFSLVELLVVITIIGILISLLLPAVQAAREAARRMQCSNNLKQLGLGALQHEAAQGWFPTDGWSFRWVGDPDKGFGAAQPGGWFYNILPYIEQQAFHDVGAGKPDGEKQALWSSAIATPMAIVFCPSRRPPLAAPQAFYWQQNVYPWLNITYSSTMLLAKNDYAINAGNYISPPDAPGYDSTKNPYGGISDVKSTITLADIRDGASNTYLIGEKYVAADCYYNSEDYSNGGTVYSGHVGDIARYTNAPSYAPLQDREGYYGFIGFGSAHADGLNMAFCDGSVRWIGYTVDPNVHSFLGQRADGQPIDASKF